MLTPLSRRALIPVASLLLVFSTAGFATTPSQPSAPAPSGATAQAGTSTNGPSKPLLPDDAALKAEATRAIDAQYEKWKANLTPSQLEWERILAANLGPFYLAGRKKDKATGIADAWDYVEDDPKLPRVLLIGDSISRGYTLPLRAALAGKANVHRAPANCGPTTLGLKKLDIWIGDGKWDLIQFNFGIHDRKTDPAVYEANLEQIIARLEQTSAKLLWATTTSVLSSTNAEAYTQEQCDKVNQIADSVMKRHHIPEDDLRSTVQPRLAELQLPNNVHFKEEGYNLLAGKAALEILAHLQGSNTSGNTPEFRKAK